MTTNAAQKLDADPSWTDSLPAAHTADLSDDLLTCLLEVARANNHPISAGAAIAGLPLKDGRLTPGMVERVAARAGLTSNIIQKPIAEIPDLLFPFICLTQDRSACVVYKRDGDTFEVYSPGAGPAHIEISLEELSGTYIGYAICLKPIHENSSDKSTAETSEERHWFWSVIKGLVPDYSQVVLASFMINALAIAAPLFMLNVYDRVLPNSAFSTLWILAIGMALVLAFEMTFRVLRGAIIDSAGRRADVKLASRIFDHVLRIRLNDKPMASGAFANRLREFESVREFFSSASLIAIVDVLFISIFLYVIYLVGGPMVYIPIVAVILVLLIGLIIQPFMIGTVRKVQEEAAQKHALLIEAITGLETIKTLNAEGALLKRWEGLVGATAKSTERMRFFSLNMINTTMIIQQAVSVLIVVYGVYLYDQGDVSMGAIIATVILAGRAVAPLGMVASTLSRLQQSIVALKSLQGIMDTAYENQGADFQISRPISKGDIEFRNVSFTYPQTEAPALKGLSFHIRPRDKVGIIGKVGAGKSTLSHLIANLYAPDDGSVLIDGMNVSQLHTADVRNAMGIVLQDVVLFRGTARENIAFGKPHATDADIIKAAKLSGASEFIDDHPLGFGMPVGERGQYLSGGQRQFIALARALIGDPPIILLDEPTSAMDNASESLFMARLQAASKDKTVILSTHRQSLLAMVDKLILMDNGKIVAFGPKNEVLDFVRGAVSQEGKTQKPVQAVSKPNLGLTA